MGKRTAKPRLQPLGEVLHGFLKKEGLPQVVGDRRLKEVWDQAVGPQVAAQTFPDRVRGDTLFVRVSSSVWLHQLQFLKDEIREKFNQFWGAGPVQNIRLHVGEMPPSGAKKKRPEGGPEPPPAVPLGARDRERIAEAVSPVKDEELRRVIQRAMEAELRRRRSLDGTGR
ncbi:MAG TPA: DUF721 domain-containing protein [Syntrophales bacterium]|nr:DUF721 domain-containing protein [Syntrophales bacterium]